MLFRRNCASRDQVRALVDELREAVGREDAPVLIDQEGGRVARLRPPEWRAYPAAAMIAALPEPLALEAARLSARLIAEDLFELGITVDAAPVLDLPDAGADPVIGDRAWGTDPARVARARARRLRRVCWKAACCRSSSTSPDTAARASTATRRCRGSMTSRAVLRRTDFAPFRALAGMPWAMTAHIVYTAIDETAPATLSRIVIESVIRGEIGFDGVLVSDDVSMGALAGSLAERTTARPRRRL